MSPITLGWIIKSLISLWEKTIAAEKQSLSSSHISCRSSKPISRISISSNLIPKELNPNYGYIYQELYNTYYAMRLYDKGDTLANKLIDLGYYIL